MEWTTVEWTVKFRYNSAHETISSPTTSDGASDAREQAIDTLYDAFVRNTRNDEPMFTETQARSLAHQAVAILLNSPGVGWTPAIPASKGPHDHLRDDDAVTEVKITYKDGSVALFEKNRVQWNS